MSRGAGVRRRVMARERAALQTMRLDDLDLEVSPAARAAEAGVGEWDPLWDRWVADVATSRYPSRGEVHHGK